MSIQPSDDATTGDERTLAERERDLASGVGARAHELGAGIAELADRRDPTSEARAQSAAQRDRAAAVRDLAALARDQAADARDRAMAQRDLSYESEVDARLHGTESIVRAAARRKRAAQHYAMAAEHRALAAEDRRAAELDRERAANDRRRAATDPLTGARMRAAGLLELEHALELCHSKGSALVVAYVDVVGLKALNDGEGHRAGDQLLRRVIELIAHHLRWNDLIIRLGGDEFLCAMSNMTLPDVRERFSRVVAALADPSDAAVIGTGFAELMPGETAAQLIDRADGDLVASRNGHQDRRP